MPIFGLTYVLVLLHFDTTQLLFVHLCLLQLIFYNTKIVLINRNSLFMFIFFIPFNCFLFIFFYSSFIFITYSKIISSTDISLFSCFFIPFNCFFFIFVYSSSIFITPTKIILCLSISLFSCFLIPFNCFLLIL